MFCGATRQLTGVAMATLFIFTLSTADADILKTGTREEIGTFEGFKNGKFLFKGDDGKVAEKPRHAVRYLTMMGPREAVILRTTAKKPDKVLLIGYMGGKFNIRKDGKDSIISGPHVKQITIEPVPEGTEATGTGGGTGVIEPINLNGIEGRAGLTEEQSAKLERYKKARQKYDSFLADSSAMVARMDSAKGSARTGMINTLKSRKFQEQPLKRELESATAAMFKSFPELLTGEMPVQPVVTEARKPVTRLQETAELTLVIPKLGEDEVLLIDTAVFEQGMRLDGAKKAAIQHYNKAKREYESFTANPPEGSGNADLEAKKTSVRQAQAELMKAFPEVKLVEQ